MSACLLEFVVVLVRMCWNLLLCECMCVVDVSVRVCWNLFSVSSCVLNFLVV